MRNHIVGLMPITLDLNVDMDIQLKSDKINTGTSLIEYDKMTDHYLEAPKPEKISYR